MYSFVDSWMQCPVRTPLSMLVSFYSSAVLSVPHNFTLLCSQFKKLKSSGYGFSRDSSELSKAEGTVTFVCVRSSKLSIGFGIGSGLQMLINTGGRKEKKAQGLLLG